MCNKGSCYLLNLDVIVEEGVAVIAGEIIRDFASSSVTCY